MSDQRLDDIALIMQRPYHRVISGEPQGGFLAEVLELPGCVTAGETATEALRNLDEAMALWLACALEDGLPIPEPSAGEVRLTA
jgi:antitoxin HicB